MFLATRTGWMCALAALVLFGLTAEPVLATIVNTIHLPSGNQRVRHGVRVQIDPHWVDGSGYRPIRVTFTATPGPTQRDRYFQVELQCSGWGGSLSQGAARKTIKLPEGQTQVTEAVLVPQSADLGRLNIRIFENGRELTDLSRDNLLASNFSGRWSEATPRILFIHSDAPTVQQRRALLFGGRASASPAESTVPDPRGLSFALNQTVVMGGVVIDYDAEHQDQRTCLQWIDNSPFMHCLNLDELPDHWLHFSSFDLIFISLDDLRRLHSSAPDKLTALRRWAATGPTLCVYGLLREPEPLREIERLLKLSPPLAEPAPWNSLEGQAGEAVVDADTKQLAGWQAADPNLLDRPLQLPGFSSGWAPVTSHAHVAPGDEAGTLYEETEGLKQNNPLLIRDLAFGQLLVLCEENPFPGNVDKWTWMFNTIDASHWKWYRRNGMSLHRENTGFWNWLVPGVGMPPVTTFLVMISIFVVLIGPVNYVMLLRARRLYLLLVTVPAGAAVVTCCMFGFALLSDGLGVKSRVRSLTKIDQAAGEAVSLSRQSFYAGLEPSQGLFYPEDAAVYPLDWRPYRQTRSELARRMVDWDYEQNLQRGYLRARTMAQFYVQQPQATEARIDIDQSQRESDDAGLYVTNHLGAPIQFLVLRDEKGKIYWTENVGQRQRVLVPVREPESAVHQLNRVYQITMLSSVGVDPNEFHERNLGLDWSARQRRNIDGNEPGASVGTSGLERELARLSRNITNRSYVAVVADSPFVAPGARRAQEIDSMHLIEGTW